MTQSHKTQERLEQIQQREQAASSGPWITEIFPEKGGISGDNWCIASVGSFDDIENQRTLSAWVTTDMVHASELGGGGVESDVEFIAHSRQDIPWLLSQVASLEAERLELRAALQGLVDATPMEGLGPEFTAAQAALAAGGDDVAD